MRRASVQMIAAMVASVTVFSMGTAVMAQDTLPNSTNALPPHIETMLDNAKDDFASITWLESPRLDLVQYPERALSRDMNGTATVACMAYADGIIRHCKVLEETPIGFGFGAVALSYIASGRLHPSEDTQTIRTFKARVPFQIN